MKRKITAVLCLFCLLLCGCNSGGTPESYVSESLGYAEKYLEYSAAESAVFSLGDESLELSKGDKIGGFTLDKLSSRLDGDLPSVRATFSCDFELTARFTYKENSVYGSMIRCYPTDSVAFPIPSGAAAGDNWLVVQKSESSSAVPGLSGESAAEVTATVRVVSYSVHTSSHNTVRYIEIKTAAD